jgi:hypothetical protein
MGRLIRIAKPDQFHMFSPIRRKIKFRELPRMSPRRSDSSFPGSGISLHLRDFAPIRVSIYEPEFHPHPRNLPIRPLVHIQLVSSIKRRVSPAVGERTAELPSAPAGRFSGSAAAMLPCVPAGKFAMCSSEPMNFATNSLWT